MKCNLLALAAALLPTAAFAHVGVGSTASFAAGLAHPLTGLDHIMVMVAVGLWAALKGNRALWVWPASFVGVMLVGGALGMAHVPLLYVEPAILASVVALGMLVALAVDLPVWTRTAIVGLFALFHGHAHGSEVVETVSGAEYMAGFALATATLHAIGITLGLALSRAQLRGVMRVGGIACAAVGVALYAGMLA